jgi:hypothetical protein
METNVSFVSNFDSKYLAKKENCFQEMEKQIKCLEECMDVYRAYSPSFDNKILCINEDSSLIQKEKVDLLISEKY